MSFSSSDYSSLYLLDDPLGNTALRLEPTGWSDTLTKAQAVRLLMGDLQLDRPYQLRGYMGGRPMDILWSGLSAIIVVSQRVVDLLGDNGVTGWSTYPVEVFGRKGEPLPGYYGLSITGRTGARDKTRGEVLTKEPIVPGGRPPRVRKGVYFCEDYWDGSDMCLVEGTLFMVVTDKVKGLLNRSKIRNVQLTPLSEVELDLLID